MTTPSTTDAASVLATLEKTAIDLGTPGRDLTYGFGLVGADYRPVPVR